MNRPLNRPAWLALSAVVFGALGAWLGFDLGGAEVAAFGVLAAASVGGVLCAIGLCVKAATTLRRMSCATGTGSGAKRFASAIGLVAYCSAACGVATVVVFTIPRVIARLVFAAQGATALDIGRDALAALWGGGKAGAVLGTVAAGTILLVSGVARRRTGR